MFYSLYKKSHVQTVDSGADVKTTTSSGDTSLYLATYGVLNSPKASPEIIADLIKAGSYYNVCYYSRKGRHTNFTMNAEIVKIEYIYKKNEDYY